MQLRVQYNVEYPWQIRQAPYQAFNMTVQPRLYGRNFSHIEYNVCLSWLPSNLVDLYSTQSGLAQFEIRIPTGYRVEERFLKSLIGPLRNLGDAENACGPQINFLFEYLDLIPICFSFVAERYIPVANISRYYEMRVFEYHEPGNANRSMYFLRDLFALDICEVCGSYQCPYCPYYAFAVRVPPLGPVVLLAMAVLVVAYVLKFDGAGIG